MISIPNGVKVWLATGQTDMRRGMQSLALMDRDHAREQAQFILDEAVRELLIAMTVDFSKLWADPDTPDRERKRLLVHIIEDVTLVKMPVEGTSKIHVRFKGGKLQTLTTMSPKSSAQQVKTPSGIVELVDKLLDLFGDRRTPQRARISPGGISAA